MPEGEEMELCPHCDTFFYPHDPMRACCGLCGHPKHCSCAGQYKHSRPNLRVIRTHTGEEMEEFEQLKKETSLLKDQLVKAYQDNQSKEGLLEQMKHFLEQKNLMMEFLLFQSNQTIGAVATAEITVNWGDEDGDIPF